MQSGKKSFYVFLSSLLGLLLFILLQRSLFLLAFLLGFNVLSPSFLKLDYGSFIVAMFLGLWYGIWVGLYWYRMIYEEKVMPGMFRSIMGRFSSPVKTGGDIFSEEKSWDLADLMKKTDEVTSGGVEPDLQVFQSNTVAFATSSPLHAKEIHGEVKEVKPKKRTAKKPASKKKKSE